MGKDDMDNQSTNYKTATAFAGDKMLATGPVDNVIAGVKKMIDDGEQNLILIFDDSNARPIEFDFRGTKDEVTSRLSTLNLNAERDELVEIEDTPKGPGRPKLGVVAREITLLPRHWEWLSSQPGGASVAIRKLVETARLASSGKDRVRNAQDAAYRFMSGMAGNQPGFEEATRALFAGDQKKFEDNISGWPPDLRRYSTKLARDSFTS